MVTIKFLADNLDTVPALTDWFRAQWSDYYASRSDAQLEQAFLSEANRDRLPARLVAFESDALAGTIVLREDGIETVPEYQPELGACLCLQRIETGVSAQRSSAQAWTCAQPGVYDPSLTCPALAQQVLPDAFCLPLSVVRHAAGCAPK